MKRFVLALVAAAATSVSAQQPITTIHGLPFAPHVPTPPPVPISRLNFRNLQSVRQPSRVTFLPSYLYMPYGQMQPQENVSIINNYEQPAQFYVVPLAAPYMGGSFGVGATLRSGDAGESHPPVMIPPPRSRRVAETSDVKSIDAVVDAMYGLVSGPSFKGRDWDRYRSLFVEDAHVSATVNAPGVPADMTVLTADDYIATVAPEFQRGVFEKEVSRKVEQSGRMAHVFSTFESRRTATDEKPFQRGVNSIQLLDTGGRWWIVSLYSDVEGSGNAGPPKGSTPRQ